MMRPPLGPASLSLLLRQTPRNLLDRGRDVGERIGELGAETLNDRDDRDRDAGSNQAVFDGRRALFIAKETLKQCAHVLPSIARYSTGKAYTLQLRIG